MANKLLDSLLDVAVLEKKLKESSFNENYRILETNFGLETKEDFNKGHIKNALYFNAMQGVETSKYFPRNMPSASVFQEYVSSLGISNKHHLILYDRSQYGIFSSSRVWWIFRYYGHENVSILSGGLNAWKAKSLSLTDQATEFKREDFKVNENKNLVRNYEQIVENLETNKELLIDARPRADFSKIDPASGKPNHIPKSKNIPYNELFDPTTGTLKDREKILEMFRAENVDLKSQKLVFSCLTSVQASGLAFAAYLLDARDIPVYQGSWTEFSQKQNK